MPAWPGGPCPSCGEDMPPNLVHCQICRALLNSDLDPDSVHIPVFQPLQEIEAVIDAHIRGFFSICPRCDRELRFAKKYMDQRVACKYCDAAMTPLPEKASSFFAECPHCEKELRASMKYRGAKVACKFCEGHIHFAG